MGVRIYSILFINVFISILLFCGIDNIFAETSNKNNKKVTVGWLEKAYLLKYNFATRAKIDTGAKNSSLHATDMEYVPVEGKPSRSRIRFNTIDTVGNVRTIEADITREVRIKRSSLSSDSAMKESRIEIELDICLAGVKNKIRVNLTNREGMNYRMILGRTALEDNFYVDPSLTFMGGKKCRSFKNNQ
jgi:ribosomal protein S6--L-glutamate ligase